MKICHTKFCSLLDEKINFQDFFLKELFFSKSHLKKNIQKKIKLKEDIHPHQEIETHIDLINPMHISPLYTGPEIPIIYQDSNYLVLNKPHNIHCHPLKYSEENNCLSFLREKNIFAPLSVNCTHYDRGLIHRLDFETSGVLILVKNEDFYKKLRENFREMMTSKKYLAIVSGQFHQSNQYKFFYTPTGKRGHKIKIQTLQNDKGQWGDLKIKPLQYNQKENMTLLEIDLKTGLRHQIRVTLSHLGHPILGDLLYGGNQAKRLFLHAYHYELQKEGEATKIFESKKPELFHLFFDMNSCL